MPLQTENFRDEVQITFIPGNPPTVHLSGRRIFTSGGGEEETFDLPLETRIALTAEALKIYAVNLAKQSQSGSQIRSETKTVAGCNNNPYWWNR